MIFGRSLLVTMVTGIDNDDANDAAIPVRLYSCKQNHEVVDDILCMSVSSFMKDRQRGYMTNDHLNMATSAFRGYHTFDILVTHTMRNPYNV